MLPDRNDFVLHFLCTGVNDYKRHKTMENKGPGTDGTGQIERIGIGEHSVEP